MDESDDSQLDLLGELGHLPLALPTCKNSTLSELESKDKPIARKSSEEPFPESLLIIDTETTGLNHETDQCIEIGAILFHVNSRAVLAQQSFLLPVTSNSAQAINRIPAEVTRLNQPWQEGLLYFKGLVGAADVLVAHNAAFDRKWFGKKPLPDLSIKPWICTMDDIKWPSDRQLRARPSVRDLALAYEVPVWSAHRALADCIYIAEVFRRCDDLEILIRHGLEPRRLMRAQISYENRNLAKEAGFTWNDPVPGAWAKRVSQREEMSLPFAVVPLAKV